MGDALSTEGLLPSSSSSSLLLKSCTWPKLWPRPGETQGSSCRGSQPPNALAQADRKSGRVPPPPPHLDPPSSLLLGFLHGLFCMLTTASDLKMKTKILEKLKI